MKIFNLTRAMTVLPGFVFSFPSVQLALNKQRLVTWTQTFKCPDGPGEDPVAMLEAAIQRKAKVRDWSNDVNVLSNFISYSLIFNIIKKRIKGIIS